MSRVYNEPVCLTTEEIRIFKNRHSKNYIFAFYWHN